MSVLTAPVPLIFEASISAQMIVFAGVQAAGVGRFGALRGVLALITGGLGLAVGLNTLAAVGAVAGLRDLNLFLELACAAAAYLYVAHAYDGGARLERSALWHLAPAIGVLAVWKLGLVRNMDAPMLAILSAYAVATAVTAWRHRQAYRPVQLARFVALLAASFSMLTILRGAMMYEVDLGIAFRDSGGYMLLLAVMLVMSSSALLVELRHPNLLSAPASYIRSITAVAPSADALQLLDDRFRQLMVRDKPYLDPEVSAADLAARLGLSARQLSQFASMRYRKTVPALLNDWRVEEAARLLADPANAKPITTIMYDAGFGSKSAFQREFDKRFGMSPTAYRSAARERSASTRE